MQQLDVVIDGFNKWAEHIFSNGTTKQAIWDDLITVSGSVRKRFFNLIQKAGWIVSRKPNSTDGMPETYISYKDQ